MIAVNVVTDVLVRSRGVARFQTDGRNTDTSRFVNAPRGRVRERLSALPVFQHGWVSLMCTLTMFAAHPGKTFQYAANLVACCPTWIVLAFT